MDKNDEINLSVGVLGIARKFIMRDIDFFENIRIFTCFLFYVLVMYLSIGCVYIYKSHLNKMHKWPTRGAMI